ncbi:hypothetical protein [Pseudonocardia broussonetiae]|uniref:Uncharacterized protein n=1 Tax=Pseudonocardia broussonetiae TaxID=2736640 RepID=A0A6M6JGN1_9PSEU|nr:hypothetical protein [Pseudonocardia broussonetiae]QJY45529.1 hypothetical protein HOP40_06690 [Pseudonocardia broussonetiae]
MVIMNGQGDENQPLAVAHWEVILPLDPHRLLLLPGARARDEDPRKRVDHLLKLPAGLGQVPNQMIFDAADTRVFCHQDHDPYPRMSLTGPRLPTPWTGDTASGLSWVFNYEALDQGGTVQRRWLIEHPSPQDPATSL